MKSCTTPKVVFIVPYRDRETQKHDFIKQMEYLLSDTDKNIYRILFIHQCDKRTFNRGALKNIGFLTVKNDYPETYKSITLCFNDIDTYPTKQELITDYSTIPGIVKHFYGYRFTLGGIVSINADDFEKINGFPNYWSWGYEDNMLNNRVVQANLIVDRSVFYAIADKRISQINNSPFRTVNKIEFGRYVAKNNEGIDSIFNLRYNINDDNGVVNVTYFDTNFIPYPQFNVEYDTRLTTPPFQVVNNNRRRTTSMNLLSMNLS